MPSCRPVRGPRPLRPCPAARPLRPGHVRRLRPPTRPRPQSAAATRTITPNRLPHDARLLKRPRRARLTSHDAPRRAAEVFMAPQSRCKGCKRPRARRGGARRRLVDSLRWRRGAKPRALADPRGAGAAARRARLPAVPLDARDRPGRRRAPPGRARARGAALRGGARPRAGRAAIAFFADAGPPPADRRGVPDRAARGLAGARERGPRERAAARHARRPRPRPCSRRRAAATTRSTRSRGRRSSRPGASASREREREAGAGFPIRPGALLEKPLGLVLPLFGAPRARGAGPGRRRLSIDGRRAGAARRGATCATGCCPGSPRRTSARPRRARSWSRSCAARTGPSSTRASPTRARETSAAATSSSRSRAAAGGPPARGRDFGPARPRGGRLPAAGEPRRPPEDESPWLLVARHRGGSFEAAVASVAAAQPRDGLRRPGAARRHGARAGGLGAAGAAARAPADGVRDRRHPRAQHPARGDPLGRPEPGGRHRHRPGAGAPLRRPDREGGRPAHGARGPGARLRGHRVRQPRLRRGAALARARSSTRCCATTALVLEQAGHDARARGRAATCRELRGDAAALRRAIANLVANAVKFAAAGQAGSAVRAAARARRPRGRAARRGPRARHPARGARAGLRALLPRAGRGAQRAPGSGLGLSLVRHVVRAHGGSVRVEAREGGGAALVVELPVAPRGAGA